MESYGIRIGVRAYRQAAAAMMETFAVRLFELTGPKAGGEHDQDQNEAADGIAGVISRQGGHGLDVADRWYGGGKQQLEEAG